MIPRGLRKGGFEQPGKKNVRAREAKSESPAGRGREEVRLTPANTNGRGKEIEG